MRTSFKVIAALTGLGLIAAMATSRAHAPDETRPKVRPVLSQVVTPRTTETVGPFAGTIEPRYSASVGFKIFGRLVARDVNVGDVVKKGTRLAALDPAVQAVAVLSAEAAVANSEAQFANAVAAEKRQRALLERNVTSPALYELDKKNLDTTAATLAQAKAGLTKAQEELGDAQLYADFDGVVTARTAEVGKVLAAGEPVLTIARPDIKEAVFDVPDAMAAALSPESRFAVALELDPTITTAGRVRLIAPEADPVTRTRRVRLTLDDPPRLFRLGTIIAVSITTAVSSRIDLPSTAFLEQEGKTFVWVVDPTSKTVALCPVTVAARTEIAFVVTDGLAVGDRIVTAGVHSLVAGQVVELLEEASR